jgi:hypothetical protein
VLPGGTFVPMFWITFSTEHQRRIGLKLFGFIAELVFAFIPESCSRSSRTPFGIIPESRSPCPGFPTCVRSRKMIAEGSAF